MPPRRAKRKARVVQQEERIPTPDLQIKLQRNVDFSTLCSVSATIGHVHAVSLEHQWHDVSANTHGVSPTDFCSAGGPHTSSCGCLRARHRAAPTPRHRSLRE